MKKTIILLIACWVLAMACGREQNGANAPKSAKKFVAPAIPAMISNPQEAAEYFVSHYWAGFDFGDTTQLKPEIAEQIFVEFLPALGYVDAQKANKVLGDMMQSAQNNLRTFAYFMDITERYLYNPNSPYRNEEWYIPVLRNVVKSNLDSLSKIRPQYQLQMLLKNRIGTVANDFEFSYKNGEKSNLYSISAEYILVYFNNPDCTDCKRVKGFIENSKTLNNSALKILSVYTEDNLELWKASKYSPKWLNTYNQQISSQTIYDLKAIPTLYLLDSQKRIILKDTQIELVERYFEQLK